jgi:hypothetical protein
MEKIITVGLDLAKSIFQVHGIAKTGKSWFVAHCGDRRFYPSFGASQLAW